MIDRIKEIRKKLFKTQMEFARALNVSKQTISAYENGDAFFKHDKLMLLCKTYNININWLLTGYGSMFLDEKDNININSEISNLKKENEHLKIENNLLKELIKK